MVDLYGMRKWLETHGKTALMVARPSLTTLDDNREVDALEYRLVLDRNPMAYTAVYYAPLGNEVENKAGRQRAFDRLHWEVLRDLHIDLDMDAVWQEGEAYRASLKK